MNAEEMGWCVSLEEKEREKKCSTTADGLEILEEHTTYQLRL